MNERASQKLMGFLFQPCRLRTPILWVVLLLGSASLIAVYYAISDHLDVGPSPSSVNLTETELYDTSEKHVVSFPVPASRDAATPLAERPTNEAATTTLPARSLKVATYETSKPNGAFSTAQEITEGIIIGNRGSLRDYADYYKVRTTGHAMILRLIPSLKERNDGLMMTVFDADQRSLGRDLGQTGPVMTLAVIPQATYYIKLDLGHAPVEKPQYELHVHFK